MKKKKKSLKETGYSDFKIKFENTFNRKKTQILVFVLIINLLFNLLLFDPKLFTGGDNAVYITLAESIVSGKGYRNISHPSEPLHTQYPFGLPLLLVPILHFFGHNYILMKFLIILMGIGSVYFLWKLLLKVSTPMVTLCVVFLVAINPDIISFSHWILSEIPCLFFTILGIFCFEKSLQGERGNIKYLILSALACSYAYFIRPPGMALFIAGFAILLLRRKFRHMLIFSGVVLLCITPWLLRNIKIGALLGQSQNILLMRSVYDIESGTLTLPELLARSLANVKIYFLNIIPATTFYLLSMARFSAIYYYLFAFLTLFPTIYGFFYQVLKKFTFIHFYLVLYFIIILPWHEYVSSIRYFLPVLPFFFYFFCLGLIKLNEKITTMKRPVFLFISTIFIICIYIFYITKETPSSLVNLAGYLKGDRDRGYSTDWVRFYQAADWLRMNTSKQSIVISRKPELLYLRAKRKGMSYPFASNREKVKSYIFNNNADYIVVDRFYWTGTTVRYLIPVINENLDKFEVVYVTSPPETYVLRIKK